MITPDSVATEVQRIDGFRSDDERAHAAEDELHARVLRAIADGTCSDAAGCAREALGTELIDFARWCA